DRKVRDLLALVEDAEAKVVGRLADDGEVEPPFAEYCFGFGFLLGPKHHEHALLALRQHHLVSAHALFAHRYLVEIKPDAEIALGAHLDGRAGEAGCTYVLDGDDRAGCHQFEAGFQQALFGERITDLDGRALLLDRIVELGRRHGRATDTVAAGLGTEIDDRKTYAFGL